MIVSNPPYIDEKAFEQLDPRVRECEPPLALLGGEDGLDYYRRIAAEAVCFINQGGHILLEIGFGQKESVESLLRNNGFTDVITYKDYSGNDRIVTARRPDGNA